MPESTTKDGETNPEAIFVTYKALADDYWRQGGDKFNDDEFVDPAGRRRPGRPGVPTSVVELRDRLSLMLSEVEHAAEQLGIEFVFVGRAPAVIGGYPIQSNMFKAVYHRSPLGPSVQDVRDFLNETIGRAKWGGPPPQHRRSAGGERKVAAPNINPQEAVFLRYEELAQTYWNVRYEVDDNPTVEDIAARGGRLTAIRRELVIAVVGVEEAAAEVGVNHYGIFRKVYEETEGPFGDGPSQQQILDKLHECVGNARRAGGSRSNSRKDGPPMKQPTRKKVVIGHGGSLEWLKLREFIRERGLEPDEFNGVAAAGLSTKERLEQMLNDAALALLVMTAEDEQKDGTKRARENVVHEVGLFQGRLGFTKAIVLLERDCDEFSNIGGLVQIRFPKGDIEACFEKVRQVLVREGLVKPA
jgi:predicted nucleotide-binding protein